MSEMWYTVRPEGGSKDIKTTRELVGEITLAEEGESSVLVCKQEDNAGHNTGSADKRYLHRHWQCATKSKGKTEIYQGM